MGKKIFEGRRSVNIIVENISENPPCRHGPSILFERKLGNGKTTQYFACSACRDRKQCSFYVKKDSGNKIKCIKDGGDKSVKQLKPLLLLKLHLQKYKRLRENGDKDIGFCNTCLQVILQDEREYHLKCSILQHLSKQQIQFPSQILRPKDNPKCEAQYFFTEKSLQVIFEALERLDVKKVLCVGAPRIHELVKSQNSAMKSLLMDIDDRFCNFFSEQDFVMYNMFNHYFFCGEKSENIYREFLRGQKKIIVVADPPFGGRMELLANTLRQIERDWQSVNGFEADKVLLVIFIFPYFLEKSVKWNMPSLSMLEYLVDYDNHPLYTTGPKGMKRGSAVRMFTNLSPSLFPFPPEDGYTFCEVCERWVHPRNKHCSKCGDCTSKDGSTYTHCDSCKICVKPTWMHCEACCKCLPKDHRCTSANHTQHRSENSEEEASQLPRKRISRGAETSKKRKSRETETLKKRKSGETETPKSDGKQKSGKAETPESPKRRKKGTRPTIFQEEKQRNLLLLQDLLTK